MQYWDVMRNISKLEKNIVKHLVEARKNNRYEQMQFAYILRKFVIYDYICWNKKELKSYITTFLHGNKKDSKDVFYKIVDVIGLFEDLKRKGYILMAGTNLTEHKYPRYHFDKNKIKEDASSGLLRIEADGFFTPVELPGDEKNTYYGEIVDIIEKYMDSIVYPLKSLVDYKKHCYRTVEQRRFFLTSFISVTAIIVAIIIGFGSPIMSKCISEKSDKKNIEQIITAIQEQKSISIEHFPNIIPDTLNVKLTDKDDNQPINLNVTVKPDQPKQIK